MKTFDYSTVLRAKIERFTLLSKLRKEQSKLLKEVTYIDLDGKKSISIDFKNRNSEIASKEIDNLISQIPTLYTSFGYVCINKQSNVMQTWDIQLNNNLLDLKNRLKKESIN